MMKSQTCFRKCFSLLLAVTLVLVQTPALARCWTIETAPLDADCVVMKRGEARGLWFSLKLAEEYRQLKLKLPELALQVQKTELAYKSRKEQVGLLRRSVKSQSAAIAGLKRENVLRVRAAQAAEVRAVEAENRASRWYRSPLLWTGVGVLTTVLGLIVYNKALAED